MKQYLDTLRHILDNGERRANRTGTDTIGVFGHQMRIDLREGFPLLTTKKLPFRWIAEELLWFLRGSTDEKELRARGVDIWKEWATQEKCAVFGRGEGDLGPVYGWAWRHFGAEHNGWSLASASKGERVGFDQIQWVESEIVRNPWSRRLIVSAWHPEDAQQVALPPCHTLFQFYVGNDGHLSCHLYARSIDAFLGLPFNIASYALLTHAMGGSTGHAAGDLIISFGDLHIYENHIVQVNEQLTREPRPLPRLRIQPIAAKSVFSYIAGDFSLEGYDPHPAIRAEVAV